MVSEKVIVAILIIAILLSVLSVVLTLSIDLSGIRNVQLPSQQKTSAVETGKVGIIINPPTLPK